MACKLFILVVCFTAAVHINAIELGAKEHEHGPAEYEFHYSVHDPHTGDIKSQKESRKGHHVEGSYDLIDSDGHKRIVHYRADEHSGFEATVHREPTDIKIPIPEPQHQHHKILAAKILAPVHYSHAPAVQHYASAPQHYAPAPQHYAPAPQHYAHQPSHSAPQYGNHVSFSGPTHQYKY